MTTEEPNATLSFLSRHLDAIICMIAVLAFVFVPGAISLWFVLPLAFACVYSWQAFRRTAELEARIEMLEEEAEQQGVYLSSLLEMATKPEAMRAVAVVRDLPRNTRTAKDFN